ncbi:META domain-containing protein, partial [Falsiroseomonas oryziterrae]|uniref:META domain-containing protein n=1 Tax=Falsiroseomonas oryziterrae TaxID=2911368 RepID=UPI001F437E05
SGARYVGERAAAPLEFWERGGRARLTLGGRTLPECLRAAPAASYRASGNEPFWNLRIEGDTARLDRLGQPRHETPLDPPRVVGAATQRRGVAMAITIAPGPCRDSMTGVEMPDRVTVEAGEARLEGCGGSAEGRLLGEWRIETIGGQAVGGARPATIALRSGGAVFGQGPCNRFRGGWAMAGDALSFQGVAATRMACPEPAMAQEEALFRLFGSVRAHRFTEDGALVIEGADGTTLVARRG